MHRAPRSTGLLVVTVLLGAFTAGCADDPERGPITMLRSPDTTRDRGLEAIVDRWNEAHPDEPVEWITLDEGTDNERAQLLEVVASGQPYDVLALDMIWVAEFAAAGYLRPLDPSRFQLDQFLEGSRSAVQFEGRTWAVPSNANAALLYYRSDLLEEVGEPVPETWQELMRAAAAITSRHDDIDGYAGQYERYEGLVVNTFEAIWAEGGDVLSTDDQGNPTVVIGEPAARNGLRWLIAGVDQGLIPEEARSYREEDAIEAFQNGQLAFMRGWPNAYGRFADPAQSTVVDRFDVTTIGGPSVLGGHNLAVSHASRHPKTALDFIEFATNYEHQRRLLADHSFPASRRAVYDDSSLVDHAYLDELSAAMESARPRPAIAQYAYLSQAISDRVFRAMFESDQPTDVTVQETVDALERELQALIS